MTAIHEVQQVLWVETVHGDGRVLFLIDYGPEEDVVMVVALEGDGRVRHYLARDVRVCRNHTFGVRVKGDASGA